MIGFCTAGIVIVFELTEGIGEPPGGVPVAEAVFTNDPALRSASATTCVAVQVLFAPGASEVGVQVIVPTPASVTVTDDIVTLPVFFTVKV
jgi:hypothetical protein